MKKMKIDNYLNQQKLQFLMKNLKNYKERDRVKFNDRYEVILISEYEINEIENELQQMLEKIEVHTTHHSADMRTKINSRKHSFNNEFAAQKLYSCSQMMKIDNNPKALGQVRSKSTQLTS